MGVKWKLSGLKGSPHHGHAFSGTGDFVLGLLWYRFSQVVAASLSEEFRGWIVRWGCAAYPESNLDRPFAKRLPAIVIMGPQEFERADETSGVSRRNV